MLLTIDKEGAGSSPTILLNGPKTLLNFIDTVKLFNLARALSTLIKYSHPGVFTHSKIQRRRRCGETGYDEHVCTAVVAGKRIVD